MTTTEYRTYTLADDCCGLAAQLGETLRSIRYNPENATAEDAERLAKVRDLLVQAFTLAEGTDEHLHGDQDA